MTSPDDWRPRSRWPCPPRPGPRVCARGNGRARPRPGPV